MLTVLAIVIAAVTLAIMAVRTPSTFLFDLIESVYSHDHPVRRN